MAYLQLDYKNFGDPWEAADVNQLIDNLAFLYDGGYNADHLYDSDWFAVTTGTTYTKAHGLGTHPRHVVLLWCATDTPGAADVIIPVTVVRMTGGEARSPLRVNATNVFAHSGTDTSAGTLLSVPTLSAAGYWRVFAWLGKALP